MELILANSPQAKGRVERMKGTLQDRLFKELSPSGNSDLASANLFLVRKYLRTFPRQFGRAAQAFMGKPAFAKSRSAAPLRAVDFSRTDTQGGGGGAPRAAATRPGVTGEQAVDNERPFARVRSS